MNWKISKQEFPDSGFIDYLISDVIPAYLNDGIDRNPRITQLNNYLFSDRSNIILGDMKSIKDIIDAYVDNLSYKEYADCYTIYIDDTIKIRGTDTTISSLVSLINDGNIDIKGSKLFDDVYGEIIREKDTLYIVYTSRG